MKYWAPINSPGGIHGNDSYVNGDPSIGVQGSIPTFQSFEQPLRGLTNLITYSAMTPSSSINDLQISEAIRSQRLNWVSTYGGVADSLTCTLTPAIGSLAAVLGMPIRGIIQAANTGPATLTVNGLQGSIVRPDGTPLIAGDLKQGAITAFIWDGTKFQAYNMGWGGGGGDGGGGGECCGAAGLNGSEIYATPGVFTFTVPALIEALFIQCWGAGGSGAVTAGTFDPTGGGGGGGAYVEGWIGVTPAQAFTVTVGLGGAQRPYNGGVNGLAGGSSSFGTFATAGGGGGGSLTPSTSGVPGTFTGGQFGLLGGPGEDWGSQRRVCNGGQGGFGGGAGGLHGIAPAGQQPGGGGGGGNAAYLAYGGAGGDGMVIVRW